KMNRLFFASLWLLSIVVAYWLGKTLTPDWHVWPFFAYLGLGLYAVWLTK
ncbi:hypothetical protein LCGC14_3042630, partial [marine sediment metagenome]